MIRMDRYATVAFVLLLAAPGGCADTSSGAPSSYVGTSGAGIAGSPGTTAGPDVCLGDPGTTQLTLTEVDNGSRRCLSTAGRVEVYLHGTAGDRWSPVELAGTGLQVAPSAKGTLPVGVTAGFFAGTGPGEARLRAFRSPCHATVATTPGCDPAHILRITVVVR